MISIVVPCFNEEESIDCFYRAVTAVAERMLPETFEFIFVDDGSRDRTLELIRALAGADERVKYISFSRNFGKEAAMYAGLKASRGDYAATMDVDMQDPPELLPEMLRALREEDWDTVATRRVTRKGEPPIRSWFARRFYRLINKISDVELVDGARDFRLMKRKVVDAVLSLGEYNRFSKGLFAWVGFKTKWLEYENVERVAGETKWSFKKLFVYAIDGIVAFSTVPLVLSAAIGLLACFASFIAGVVVLVRLASGMPTAGWALPVCILALLGGLQMLFTGIVGQYLSKTYLEVKKRPIYICAETNLEEYEREN